MNTGIIMMKKQTRSICITNSFDDILFQNCLLLWSFFLVLQALYQDVFHLPQWNACCNVPDKQYINTILSWEHNPFCNSPFGLSLVSIGKLSIGKCIIYFYSLGTIWGTGKSLSII